MITRPKVNTPKVKTRYKPFGVDLDPDGDLKEERLPDGDAQAYYKGKKIDYDKDMIDILEERADRISRGLPPTKKIY